MKLVNCTTEYVNQTTPKYSARAQDGTQEMERNEATAKHVAWPSCAWLQSFIISAHTHVEHVIKMIMTVIIVRCVKAVNIVELVTQ